VSDSADVNLYTAVGAALTATNTGNVGIGTTTPAARLDVRGDILLGPSGQYRATAGEERLRIVRGAVIENGPDVGTGFSVTGGGTFTGDYVITFTTPFSATPTVTATAHMNTNTNTVRSAMIVERDSAHVRIVTFYDQVSQRASFDFIAIGPR
jgi:hypothetical protein